MPQLTVMQNLLLGRTRKQRASAQDDIDRALKDVHLMGFPMEARTPVGRLSPAQRHALTIARAFAFGAKIVALDEPTTSMLEHNVEGSSPGSARSPTGGASASSTSRTRCRR